MANKIMVVDDDPGVVYTIKNGLESLSSNYEIITAENGKKCLEILANNQIPDLIILDILMPEMSGWETFQKIRERLSGDKLPIIFLTARKDQIAKNAGGFLGEDYIEKPFKLPELKEKIDKILNKNP
ncbi:MAG: response regulator [Thermoplasmatales archaeon]|nr:MAG: response regulator [Thermoplasmatales archaeon]